MLNTLASGSQAGSREHVGQRAERRVGDDDAVRVPRRQTADRGERRGIGRHPAAVGDDRGEVAAGADRDERDARDRDVAQDGHEDDRGRRDVDGRARVADQAADRVA